MIDALVVATGPLLVLGILLYINVKRNADDLKKNWTAYRCNPAYMPFSSMFSDVSASANFSACVSMMAKEVMARATDPIYVLFDMFANALNSILDSNNSFLGFLAGLSKFIFTFASVVFGKLTNTFATLGFQMGHVRDVVNRIATSGYYAAFMAQTVISQVMALFNFISTMLKAVVIMIFAIGIILSLFYPILLAFFLPIGAAFGITFCFHPDTPIETDRGIIPIKQIQLGDVLQGGSRVTSIFAFECGPRQQLFEYNGIIVSGDHLVLHKNTWKYVKDTGAPKFTGEYPKHIICLNTSDNKIQIGNSIFADYEETDEPNAIREIEHVVWGRRIHVRYPVGLSPRTLVRTVNDELVPISTLRVGDELAEGRIEGIVRIDASEIIWYDIEGCLLSGCQPIHLDSVKLAKEVGRKCEYSEKYAVQLFLDSPTGWFTVHDRLMVRDYPDSHDPDILEEIQQIVLKGLNKK
jgi:hypothetical protein